MPTVQFKDYYKTLGIDRGADEKAVRAAYRKLARKHHPDINPGDKGAEERFKEINEAYEVLSDPAKRKMYDRYGDDWQRYRDAGFTGNEPAGQPFGGSRAGRTGAVDPNDFGAWFNQQRTQTSSSTESRQWTSFDVSFGDGDGNGEGGGFSDFFQTLFGGARAGRQSRGTSAPLRPRRGEDAEVPVDVGFEEAYHGATRAFELQTPERCATCGGSGLARGATCPTCDGTGTVRSTKTIEVRIPPGVATGSRIRVAGHGGLGENNGPRGDLYLRVTVRPDPRFERDGDDLRTEIEVPLYTAVLGGEVVVPTPTGRVALTIPPETQSGRLFRLRKLGMPKLKAPSERGDLLARARVAIPTDLSERERHLYEELRQLRPEGR